MWTADARCQQAGKERAGKEAYTKRKSPVLEVAAAKMGFDSGSDEEPLTVDLEGEKP